MFKFTHWPAESDVITQPWANRPEYYARFGWAGGHEGVDLRAPLNSKIFAAADGTVRYVTNLRYNGRPSAYGWHVVIDHSDGYATLYAHLRPDVRELLRTGQRIYGGDVIGFSGNTGNSDGPHLHLSLFLAGSHVAGFPQNYVDPTPFLLACSLDQAEELPIEDAPDRALAAPLDMDRKYARLIEFLTRR
jgi:murein DD-endopeptidase MepM/ murein hydrolase activator NlpD